MRLQTKYSHKKLTTITVNGRAYEIDSQCCIDVDNDADSKKLLSLGDEWSLEVRKSALHSISKIPEPGKPMRSAVEFVTLLGQDTELATRVASLRSFAALSSLATNLGFRFTENEFKAATDQLQRTAEKAARVDAASAERAKADAAKVATKAPPAPEKPKGKKAPAYTPESETLPKVLEEEGSGVWPDPAPEMSAAYLKRMAAAYEVKYDATTTKDALIGAIRLAMFE